MSTVQEIERAIRQLPPEDLAALRTWFLEYDAQVWDERLERDAKSGLLDRFADEALTDLREGRCTEL